MRLHVKYPLFLSHVNETRIFLRLNVNIEVSNFMKICSVGAQMFHADRKVDGWRDLMMLIVAFRNLQKCIKMILQYCSFPVRKHKVLDCLRDDIK